MLSFIWTLMSSKPTSLHSTRVHRSTYLCPKCTLAPMLIQDIFPTMSFESSMERVSLCCWYDKYRVEPWECGVKVSQNTADMSVYIKCFKDAICVVICYRSSCFHTVKHVLSNPLWKMITSEKINSWNVILSKDTCISRVIKLILGKWLLQTILHIIRRKHYLNHCWVFRKKIENN